MACSAADPTLWEDDTGSTPPHQWQAIAEDERWWWDTRIGGGLVADPVIHLGDYADLPQVLEFCWEQTEPATGTTGDVELCIYASGTEKLQTIKLIDRGETGSGTVEVDLSTILGGSAFTFSFGIEFSGGVGDDYGGVTALLGPNLVTCDTSFNCTHGAYAKARTLSSLRDELIEALGFVTLKSTQTTKTLAELRSYMLRRGGYGSSAANPPPGVQDTIDELLNEAQDIVWRRYAYDSYTASAPTAMSADGDTCSVDHVPLQLLALANWLDLKGAPVRALRDQYDTYIQELLERRPLNLEAIVDSYARAAQELLYHQYKALETERYFQWDLLKGVRYYGLANNGDCAEVELNRYRVTAVYLQDVPGNWWRPLIEGIPGEYYTTSAYEGWPTRYEIRQCIELFPAPNASERFKLRIKGHFGLGPLVADADQTTIDGNLVFLHAAGALKRLYGQRDADDFYRRAARVLQSLVAGAHHTRRYLPGEGPRPPSTPPTMTEFIE